MPDVPAASVILPINGDALRLEWVLEGLCHQTCNDFELIVVDDAYQGFKNTRAVWKKYLKRLDTKWVINLPRSPQMRKSEACNLGVAHSRANTLVFIDGDMVADHDWIEAHLTSQAPGYCMSYGWRRHVPVDQVKALQEFSRWQDASKFLQKVSGHVDRRMERPSPSWKSVYGCSVSMPAHAYCAIGGNDERFVNWGCEDNDLADRMRRQGLRLECLGERGLATHLDHPLRYEPGRTTPNHDLLMKTMSEPMLRNSGPLVRHFLK